MLLVSNFTRRPRTTVGQLFDEQLRQSILLRNQMRGAFDFETRKDWVTPLCCVLLTEADQHTDGLFVYDPVNGKSVAGKVLEAMAIRRKYIGEWWAHNAGKFDFLLLLEAAIEMGWQATAIVAGGNRVIVGQLFPPGESEPIMICDSYAVVQAALCHKEKPKGDCKCAACSFELPSRKLFKTVDYSRGMESLSVEDLKAGCVADTRMVLELLSKVETLVEEWGGKLKKTFSSTALSIVKANIKEKLPWIKPEINTVAGYGYYGARVEVFEHLPRHEIEEWDVNSSYPWSMSQVLPWEPESLLKGKRVRLAYARGKEGIVHARVTVPEDMHLPPLPFRLEDEGIYFPTGTWEAWFPANELRYADSLGCTVEVLSMLTYSSAKPFSEFIAEVYETKAKSKGALREFTKLILNGGYGKFAERPEHDNLQIFATTTDSIAFQMEHSGQCTPLDREERFLAVRYEKWAKHAHYAIAAYITAYSRILLHKRLMEAIRPAYCDTDSVHAKHWNGESNKLLGGLKLEFQKAQMTYYAAKIYKGSYKDGAGKRQKVMACKGFPVDEKSFAEMIRSAVELEAGVEVERM